MSSQGSAGSPLDDFPRIRLSLLPTPLEPLPRLSKELGGPAIWVKRDDCTSLGGGGNKARKLEFLMAAAHRAQSDAVVTAAAVQSNHARLTAAAAARLGMACHLLLYDIVPDTEPDYRVSGNLLLDRLYGAELHHLPDASDIPEATDSLVSALREAGGNPYVIPNGGSSPLGALGYVDCAYELVEQAKQRRLAIDRIILATGSSGTQAGLVTGLHLQGSSIAVLGICTSRSAEEQQGKVSDLCGETLELLGCTRPLTEQSVMTNGDYVGEGDGIPTREMVEAISLAARSEGLLLDPVYTGKAMAGLVDLVRRGAFENDRNVVFLHTGGSPALFAYRNIFDDL